MKHKTKIKLIFTLAFLLILAGITFLNTKIFIGLGFLTFSFGLAIINKKN